MPYLVTNKDKVLAVQEEIKKEVKTPISTKLEFKKNNDESDMHTEQNVKLPEVIGEEDPNPVKEKHHKDKSKCPICIRKRAQRKKEKAIYFFSHAFKGIAW